MTMVNTDPNASASTASTTASASDTTTAAPSAATILQQVLDQYGLSSMMNWALNEVNNGASADQVQLDLYNQPQFKQRFPAIFDRAAKGLPPITPAQYIAYEDTAAQIGSAAGLPSGFIESYVDNAIANDVSTSELNDRVVKGLAAVTQAPPDVRQAFQQYFGIDSGHLAAYFLDPQNALPYLERQVTAAQIGADATRTGWGSLAGSDAMNLAQMGITDSQADSSFKKLAAMKELMGALPGEAGGNISQATQLGAEFAGNAQDALAIQRRQQTRQAAFSGGGSFVEGSQGASGLGAAQQAV